jgi:hypothetical protein
MVISLVAKGLTTGEISAHLAEVYGAEVSRQTHLHDHRQGHRGYGGGGLAQQRPDIHLSDLERSRRVLQWLITKPTS